MIEAIALLAEGMKAIYEEGGQTEEGATRRRCRRVTKHSDGERGGGVYWAHRGKREERTRRYIHGDTSLFGQEIKSDVVLPIVRTYELSLDYPD